MMTTDAAAGHCRAVLPLDDVAALRIYVGHDRREQAAFDVAAKTAFDFGHHVIPLSVDRLRYAGLFTRPVDTRGGVFDLISGRFQSTDFALSRFWVPLLAHNGFALYTDCDVVFMRDPRTLLMYAARDPGKAVYVVKHPPLPESGSKMDGQQQVPYDRKNWSSVCLWDVSHAANGRLNVGMLNSWHRDDLHGFRWLHDDEIGELPPECNWLVGVESKPTSPIVVHFTNGGPWLPGWNGAEYDDIWTRASER